MTKTAPDAAYEFVITQLILRAYGLRTSEMQVVIMPKTTKSTSVDLKLAQGNKKEVIVIGVVNLESSKVKKTWPYWTEVAAADVLRDFDKYKEKSTAFKCAEVLLKHLMKIGFELQDTPIIETHDVKLVH